MPLTSRHATGDDAYREPDRESNGTDAQRDTDHGAKAGTDRDPETSVACERIHSLPPFACFAS
jgi:hypothetical protein